MLFVAVALSMSMFAKDEQKIFVQSGDLSFLKDPVLALNSYDFSKTVVVEFTDKMKVKAEHGTIEEYNAERGENYVNDWPTVQKALIGWGLSKLNNKKGLLNAACTKDELALLSEKEKKTYKNLGAVLPTDKEIKYQCKFTIDTIDLGSTAAAVFLNPMLKVGGSVVTGSLEVINLETNASVCTLTFRNCKGWSNTSETGRMGFAIKDVYDEMLKEAKAKK